ncbi:6-phosphogluconolactonase [Plesiocystis pacifica SIR-1]|uniref:6-phosphogluconolactonase n=1 Tax=Plesiocystis pacifica SIR-1 TaxID=391625 RepID=A6FX55_9BACT|nr:6-phosphogluconolactonase [Plesiocystis pacifica]EDM81879.1 6-phosphogluconolactonase [Plesiocystis pacifica SIR-1]
MSIDLHEAEGRRELGAAVARRVLEALGRALASSASARALVSGGSTPGPFFDALVELGSGLDWSRVEIGLVDDRWVPPDHPASNLRLVRERLCRGPIAEARVRGLGAVELDARASVRAADERARSQPPPAVVVLGMGGDGHFASLFPGMPGLAAALDVDAPPGVLGALAPSPPQARVSHNLAALLAADDLILHITGAEKREVFERARADAEPALPVRALLRAAERRERGLAVYWAP